MSVADSLAGKSGKCKCGNKVTVPGSNSQPDSSASKLSNDRIGDDSAKGDAAPAAPGLAGVFDELTESDYGRRSPYEQLYSPTNTNNDRATLKKFDNQEEELEQKAGVAKGMLIFIAILNFLNGIGCGVMAVLFIAASSIIEMLAKSVPELRLGVGLGIAFFSVATLIFMAGGVGLLMRKAWGWFLTAMVFSYLIVVRLAAIGMVIADGFEQGPFFSALVPLLAIISLSAFVFKEDTRKLFRIRKALTGIIAGILGVVAAAGTLGIVYALVRSAAETVAN